MVLLISKGHYFHCWMKNGASYNTKSELIALWELLKFTLSKNIFFLQVYGDSEVIMAWVYFKECLQVIHLEHQQAKIQEFKAGYFLYLSIIFIYSTMIWWMAYLKKIWVLKKVFSFMRSLRIIFWQLQVHIKHINLEDTIQLFLLQVFVLGTSL